MYAGNFLNNSFDVMLFSILFQQTLPPMLRQVQQLEEKYKDIAQLKTMKEQVEELKKERVWAEVIDAEKVNQRKKISYSLCWKMYSHMCTFGAEVHKLNIRVKR